MSYIKTANELKNFRASAQILKKTQDLLKTHIKDGVTLKELDALAENFILTQEAIPTFKNFPGEKCPFPGTLCTMINSEIVHGIPDSRKIKHGDLLTIDCGVYFQGMHSDAAFSLVVGIDDIENPRKKFEMTVKKALQEGCKKAIAGNTTGDIGFAIQTVVESAGYSICREYTGHGLGKELHEDPHLYNHGDPGSGSVLKKNMCLAIEPIVAMGKPKNKTLSDGWTVVTFDGKDACQWEHCGIVQEDCFEILV